jgi:2-methylisocitrate lyase-like PEP mutase family enzyme
MLGIPDHSLITMTELLAQARNVAAAVNIPSWPTSMTAAARH